MNKEFIFAIDVDGVLRNNLPVMLDLYNKSFNDTKQLSEITEFKTELSFPKIKERTGIDAGEWFFTNHSKELFTDAKPFPHIQTDINILKQYGKVVIVSYQKGYENKIRTLKWLSKYDIDVNEIAFLKDKSKYMSDYFIDDNDYNLKDACTHHKILIDAPYNQKCNDNDIVRFNSFHNFVIKFSSEFELANVFFNMHKDDKLLATKIIPFNDNGYSRYFDSRGDVTS